MLVVPCGESLDPQLQSLTVSFVVLLSPGSTVTSVFCYVFDVIAAHQSPPTFHATVEQGGVYIQMGIYCTMTVDMFYHIPCAGCLSSYLHMSHYCSLQISYLRIKSQAVPICRLGLALITDINWEWVYVAFEWCMHQGNNDAGNVHGHLSCI